MPSAPAIQYPSGSDRTSLMLNRDKQAKGFLIERISPVGFAAK